MEDLIKQFELTYPGWSWLCRNQPVGYMTHLMSPLYIASFGDDGPHVLTYADNPTTSFQNALNQLNGEAQ